MRAVVVYESMYGNTHQVAEAIADGLRELYEVVVLPVAEADQAALAGADLLVVGGPTHAHGMSREATRATAREGAEAQGLELDPDAAGPGLRDWFASIGRIRVPGAAAFDTRFHAPAVFTGRASRGITRQLERHGVDVVADPESFLVDKDHHLDDGEAARAREWGAMLAGVRPGARSS